MKNTSRRGDFILQFIDFFDEPLSRRILFDLVRGPVCRYCHKSVPQRHLNRFYEGKSVYCSQCNCRFYAQAGTILAGAKISFKQILKIFCMLDMEKTTKEIAIFVDIEPHTISRWRKKFKELKNG